MTDCCTCNTPIEEDAASTSVSCCGGRWHTNCFLSAVFAQHTYYANTVKCPGCQTDLVQLQPLYGGAIGSAGSVQSGAEELATLMQNPQFRMDLKATRSKIRDAQKANGIARRYATARGAAFQQAIQPHVDAIKDAKRAALADIKASPEVCAHAAASRAAEAAKTRFCKKFNVAYPARWQLFRYDRRRRSRRGHYGWLGLGRFRIYI